LDATSGGSGCLVAGGSAASRAATATGVAALGGENLVKRLVELAGHDDGLKRLIEKWLVGGEREVDDRCRVSRSQQKASKR